MILLLSLLSSPASAELPVGAYTRVVDLIDGLYLRPGEVDSVELLVGAADALARELPWLQVEQQGNAVNIVHGDGTQIGSVSVATLQTVPDALQDLEDLIRGTGHDLGTVDLRLVALQGATKALDRYSRVLAGARLDRFDVRLRGTQVGVGIFLLQEDEGVVVGDVDEGGPAERAGLRKGDRLLEVGSRAAVTLPVSEVGRRLRGEEGSSVRVVVLRRGERMTFNVTRATVTVPNVHHRALEGGVGYLRITHMSQRTVFNLERALEVLDRSDAAKNGIVLDLRGNTGGSMMESARVADHFVEHGLLLRTVGPDGGQVRNLQARMDANPGGRLVDRPVVVLVDERTASGAEILAGALLELDRAVLLGVRTYGKGTVQKIYPLGEGARLKLTVAEYRLANDRTIAVAGLKPDAVVGRVELDRYGVHYDDWDVKRAGVGWNDIVPWIVESSSFRDGEPRLEDRLEELARRVVVGAAGPSRAQVLDALAPELSTMRTEEEGYLMGALAAQGIDWSLPETPLGRSPRVSVRLFVEDDPDDPSVRWVKSEVTSLETEQALHQVSVELSSDFSGWDGLSIPVGRLVAGGTLSGDVRVRLRSGIRARVDEVVARVRVASREPVEAARVDLQASSRTLPALSMTASLQPDRIRIDVRNDSDQRVEDVLVKVQPVPDGEVAFIDRAGRIASLPPGGSGSVELQIEAQKARPEWVRTQFDVRPRGASTLHFPVTLPADGASVLLQPPRIEAGAHPLQHPAMTLRMPFVVRDDGRIDHVLVWHNDKKIHWLAGGEQMVSFAADLKLEPGVNHIRVSAIDEQGLKRTERYIVQGKPTDGIVSP